jgi:alpha-galactosidase
MKRIRMSAITYGPATRTWLLSTPHSSYALRLDDDEAPCHLHWGSAITLAQAEAIPRLYPPHKSDSFEGRPGHREEAAIDGGTRYGVAGLQVRFADGTHALEWAFAGQEVTEDKTGAVLELRLRDRYYPLEVTLVYRVRHESDVIERSVRLRHSGEGDPIDVLRADSANWALPRRENFRVSHVIGGWSAETRLRRAELPWGETVFTSRRGVTSHQANPWVMLDGADADEDRGQVWSAALAWSGSWRLSVTRAADGTAAVTGGFGRDGVDWSLAPGEVLETPVFAGLYSVGGFGATSRAWHQHVVGHVLPHPQETRPVLYNSWEATGFDVDEAGQRKLADRAAALGVELFVMDDGWYGGRRSDNAGLGDWQPNPAGFPSGLRPLVEHVHGLGMGFGLWVEPEMVNPDSDLYRSHPDWVLHFPHRTRSELRNQLVLNFARPDVADWAHDWLDRLVGEQGVDFLKWDMNRAMSEVGWPERGVAGDRLWIDYVRNLYGVVDRLRAAHPHLRIESCSGGGGRLDLGILSRTDQVWPSDNTDARDRLTIQHGFSQLYPARVMACWVTDSPNPLTGRPTSLRYRCHVAMNGILSLGGDLTEWSEQEMAEAAAAVARYKGIRDTVQHGIQHRLRAPDAAGTGATNVSAVQYTSSDAAQVAVLAFRDSASFGKPPAPLPLAGLDPEAGYRDRETGRDYDGALLGAIGLPLELPPGDYSSTLVVLDRVAAKLAS